MLCGIRGADCGRLASPTALCTPLAPPCDRINGGLVLEPIDEVEGAADGVLLSGDLDLSAVLCASAAVAALDAPSGFPAAALCTPLLYRPLGSTRLLLCPWLLTALREALDEELEEVLELVDLRLRLLLPAPLSGVPELSESVGSACDDEIVTMSEALLALASLAAGAMATSE